MIQIIEYAVLANHVYTPNKPLFGINIDKRLISNGKCNIRQANGWYRVADVDSTMHDSKPFFCQLYIKFAQDKATAAVMAIRGTVVTLLDNIIVDMNSWLSDIFGQGDHDKIPTYLAEAMLYYRMSKEYLQRHFKHLHQIKLTGHSLGGAIAQLLVLSASAHTPAVVFNSPGCGHMPHIHQELGSLVYSVNAHYDFINKVGVTVSSHLYIIEVADKAVEAKLFFEAFNKKAYEYSSQSYQKAANDSMANFYANHLKALAARCYAYSSTFPKLAKVDIDYYFRQWQNQLMIINNPHPSQPIAFNKTLIKNWYELQYNFINAMLTLAFIDPTAKQYIIQGVKFPRLFFSAFLSYVKTPIAMVAQHSMDNMVKALHTEPNLAVACSYV